MWLSDVTPEDSVTKIGRKLKERLGVDENVSCFTSITAMGMFEIIGNSLGIFGIQSAPGCHQQVWIDQPD